MRRTQSFKLSIANYSKTSAFCGSYSAKIRTANLRLRAFFRGKGRPLLYPILPPRREISRGDFSPKIAHKHTLVFARLLFV